MNEYKNFNNNWFVNISGQVWITQVTGYGDHAYNNTIINMNSAGGIGVSVNSGANYATVANNTAYGVYNYSFVVGSNEDGALNTIYYGNIAYDIGVHSVTELTYGSRNETWNNVNYQPILISNGNMSFNQVTTNLVPYVGHTTTVNLVNSAFSQVILAATPNGGSIYNRYVLPNDFNITICNSYVPALWPVFDANNGSYYSKSVDPFSFSNGPCRLSRSCRNR